LRAATPVIVRAGGPDELINNGSHEVIGDNPGVADRSRR
jgi:hypothetical protein